MRRRVLARVGTMGLALVTFAAGPVMAVSRDASIKGDIHVQAKQPRQPAQRQVALGVSRWDGRDMKDLDAYIASVGGRAPATWTIWSSWGSAQSRDFPTTAAKGAQSRGAAPMIWWQPEVPSDQTDCTFSKYADIARGDRDKYITDFARAAKGYKKTVLLRFAHEANGGNDFPWTVANCENDLPSYLAAWRHVHDIFKSVGAGNVKFIWSVAKRECVVVAGCNPYLEFYPGDAYVDCMGFSAFNWGAHPRKTWVSMEFSFRRVTHLLGQISNKPIIAVETASNPEGGDKAAWIRDGYPEVYATFPQIVAITYLDADLRNVGHPDWRLQSPPEALEAYAEVVDQPGFQGQIPGR